MAGPPPRTLSAAVAGALTLALTACGSTSTPTPAAPASTSAGSSTTSSASSSGPAATGVAVRMATTPLGSVVVDSKGLTLYMYTKDTKDSGKSSCTGQCLAAWPPLFAAGTPTGDGVSGTLATIDTPDGKKQVTLNGWPLYYYVKDTKAGDVTGQNVGKVWFVLDQAGKPIMTGATGGPTG